MKCLSKKYWRIFRTLFHLFSLMPSPLQSPFPNILPFLSGIRDAYWKWGVVPSGKVLLTGNPTIDDEYLYMMVHSPNPWTVSYTGDSMYPQFSEAALGAQYAGQCVALAKVISDTRNRPTNTWLPWVSLLDFCLSPESILPSSYQGLMIACFDGKPNYSLAQGNHKHVAILLDIVRDKKWAPKSIVVIDQNYYSYAPYREYAGKIAKHTIPWGSPHQRWVGYARSYNIVNT